MKVRGEEIRNFANLTFELYLVDEIAESDVFVQILGNSEKSNKLSRVVYTNGKIEIISKRGILDNSKLEVKYKLERAGWLVIYENDVIQLFVKEEYDKKVRTKNRRINSVIKRYYDNMKERILDKRFFAEDMDFLASFMDLPFEIVLSFKGNIEDLDLFVTTIENAIKNCFYADGETMKKLIHESHAVRMQAFEFMGLYIPEEYLKVSFRIGKYVYDCMKAQRIIRYKNK